MARSGEANLLVLAYAEAWRRRAESGDDSVEVLMSTLRSHGFAGARPAEPVQGVVVRLWKEEVPPEHFEAEFQRRLRPLLWKAGRDVLRTHAEIVREFLSMEWTPGDNAWVKLPEGVKRLSDARKSNDIVLRHFHAKARQETLPFELANDEVLREHPMPSSNRDQAWEYPVWLVLATRPHADVMVGPHRVGDTELDPDAWDALEVEARSGVHSDGRLIVPWSREGPPRLTCWLPG